mmetsp:Transcript_21662/g.53228  ORF Transcript_21662/g.53228 Transcript_21662/m.53228 type:complete len:229 (-) Transcript_21662:2-688(-)
MRLERAARAALELQLDDGEVGVQRDRAALAAAHYQHRQRRQVGRAQRERLASLALDHVLLRLRRPRQLGGGARLGVLEHLLLAPRLRPVHVRPPLQPVQQLGRLRWVGVGDKELRPRLWRGLLYGRHERRAGVALDHPHAVVDRQRLQQIAADWLGAVDQHLDAAPAEAALGGAGGQAVRQRHAQLDLVERLRPAVPVGLTAAVLAGHVEHGWAVLAGQRSVSPERAA